MEPMQPISRKLVGTTSQGLASILGEMEARMMDITIPLMLIMMFAFVSARALRSRWVR